MSLCRVSWNCMNLVHLFIITTLYLIISRLPLSPVGPTGHLPSFNVTTQIMPRSIQQFLHPVQVVYYYHVTHPFTISSWSLFVLDSFQSFSLIYPGGPGLCKAYILCAADNSLERMLVFS